jgi:hypothetical protein
VMDFLGKGGGIWNGGSQEMDWMIEHHRRIYAPGNDGYVRLCTAHRCRTCAHI